MFIDTHCHLYSDAFDADREEAVQRAKATGIERILMPNVDAESVDGMLAMQAAHPAYCMAMMGLHPCSVADDLTELELQLKQVDQYLATGNFVAVGEIGIDLFWRQDNLDAQLHAFHAQCSLAVRLGLPVAIHSRSSMQEVISALQSMMNRPTGVLHCFTGNVEEALALIDLGFYLGVGGVVTHKQSTLREVCKAIGPEKLLLETDAPYLAPVPHRGKRNEPAYVPLIAQVLADALEMSLTKLATITTANAYALFPIKNNEID